MIKSRLEMALDFAKDKKKTVPHEVFTYQKDGTWYIVKCGPTYSNTHKVLEFDDAGLQLLKSKEQEIMKIIDPAALATPRSPVCEYCGTYCRKPTERHHIVSRGMGGGSRLDIPENLIDLGGVWDCNCHGRAQAGDIDMVQLFEVVAARLKTDPVEMVSKVRRLVMAPKGN